MALIKFRKAENALEFAEAYNGKKFNSMTVSTSLRCGRCVTYGFSPHR